VSYITNTVCLLHVSVTLVVILREHYKGYIMYILYFNILKERDHLEDPGIDGRIIFRWIFRKWDVGAWTGSSWLRIGSGGGTCECGNTPSVSIKCGEFLD
jgi:hypothetical protein